MCGIGGVLRVHDPADGVVPSPEEAIPKAWLDVLDESIRHRGPDGAGRFRDRVTRADGRVVDVALVHRRLAIIDLGGGHQPMVHSREADEGDLVAVVFNGCIYNHRELRSELESLGHRFVTDHSDTEVLIHGWRAWGLEMQERLDGMYGFLLWDRATGQLAWGRDLVGEKPLYSTAHYHTHCFSSSAVGLMRYASLAFDEPLNPYPPALELWLASGAEQIPPLPVFAVDSGELAVCPPSPGRGGVIRGGNASLQKYGFSERRWCPPPRDGADQSRENTALNESMIERAVASRLEADVPLGVFLSGGLDSALITAIAHNHRPDLQAFTVRMPEKGYDESGEASETARAIGVRHTVLECEANPAEDLVRLIEQLGLPFGDSSLLPTYWVSRAARAHIKVALSGDGGDELFGGYRRHTINGVLNRWRWLLRLVPDGVLPRRDPRARSTYLARLAVAARHGGYAELGSIFATPDMRRLMRLDGGALVGLDSFRMVEDPLREDFNSCLPDDLLRKTDTASMAVGLEVRAPFLARELVEAALRTPLDVLMPGGERKGLLKRVARGYLPAGVIERPKKGFAVPIGRWFREDYGGLRQLLHDHLLGAEPFPGLGEAGIEIDLGFVRRLLREHDAAGAGGSPWKGRDHSQRLYMLLVLSIWCRWLDRVRRDSTRDGGVEGVRAVALDPDGGSGRF